MAINPFSYPPITPKGVPDHQFPRQAQNGDLCQLLKPRNGVELVDRQIKTQRASGTRKQTSVACLSCFKAKAGCDQNRPCGRCARLGKTNCIDRQHKRVIQKSNSSATSSTSTNSVAARRHFSTVPACMSCKMSKVWCDKGSPCKRCVRLKRDCVRPIKVPKSTKRKRQVVDVPIKREYFNSQTRQQLMCQEQFHPPFTQHGSQIQSLYQHTPSVHTQPQFRPSHFQQLSHQQHFVRQDMQPQTTQDQHVQSVTTTSQQIVTTTATTQRLPTTNLLDTVPRPRTSKYAVFDMDATPPPSLAQLPEVKFASRAAEDSLVSDFAAMTVKSWDEEKTIDEHTKTTVAHFVARQAKNESESKAILQYMQLHCGIDVSHSHVGPVKYEYVSQPPGTNSESKFTPASSTDLYFGSCHANVPPPPPPLQSTHFTVVSANSSLLTSLTSDISEFPCGIIRTSFEFNSPSSGTAFVEMNDAVCQIFGRSRHDIIANIEQNYKFYHQKDWPRMLERIIDIVRGGTHEYSCVVHCLQPSGALITCVQTYRLIFENEFPRCGLFCLMPIPGD